MGPSWKRADTPADMDAALGLSSLAGELNQENTVRIGATQDVRSEAPARNFFAPLPEIAGGWRCVLADPPWRFASKSDAAPGRNVLAALPDA